MLLPFKTAVIVMPLIYVTWEGATREHRARGIRADVAGDMAGGFLVCIVFLLLGAMVQFGDVSKKAAYNTLLFAIATIILLAFWLPLSAR